MPAYYDRGDVVRVSSTFTDTGGAKANPTNVATYITRPDGGVVATTFSTGAGAIKRPATGVFYQDILTTASGPYWYRFTSTGNISASAEWVFRVRHRYST